MAKITITIARDPSKGVIVAVEGFAGPSCQKLTENVERALGKTVSDELTDEFHHAETRNQQHQQEGFKNV